METHKTKDQAPTFVLVPEQTLRDIHESLIQLKEAVLGSQNQDTEPLMGNYINEKQAQKLLGKKSTTLWKLRQEGKLGFAKVGNKVYYDKGDIELLLKENKKKRFIY